MTFSDASCPQGQSQSPAIDLSDKVVIDRETFRQIFSLLNRSVDILVNARHYEIFLDSLDTYLSDSNGLDADQCFRASLLLDSWIDFVPDALLDLDGNLDELRKLMLVVFVASGLGGSNE